MKPTLVAALSLLIGACAPRTVIEVSEYYPKISLSHYSKTYSSINFDLKLNYVGMNDSAFTFEIRLKNRSDSSLSLHCDSSRLQVIWCSEIFQSRIKSHSTKIIEVNPHESINLWLQFTTEHDILPCFLNGGKITLMGITVKLMKETFDFGVFEFQPLSLRLR